LGFREPIRNRHCFRGGAVPFPDLKMALGPSGFADRDGRSSTDTIVTQHFPVAIIKIILDFATFRL
jgi:hypothetical protein